MTATTRCATLTSMTDVLRAYHADEDDVLAQQDHVIRILGARWSDYLRQLKLRGEASCPRITFVDGVLELISPSRGHESISARIQHLIAVFCEVNDIEFEDTRSTTLKNTKLARGSEPDLSYCFGSKQRKIPDLAVEVVWTSNALDKLPIYHGLGVPEVWIWRAGKITVRRRATKRYETSARSKLLHNIDLVELTVCLAESTTSAAMKRFRAHCQKQKRRR